MRKNKKNHLQILFIRYTYLHECILIFEKKMARKTREESENTKALILQSALDCFYEKGFSRTSFEDIASRINLTKGAVYWHFKNKAELLAGLLQQSVEIKHNTIGTMPTAPTSIEELRQFFYTEAQYIEKNPDVQKFIFFSLFQVEWSDTVFNQVQAKTGKLSDFHFKIVKHALSAAKKKHEISAQTDINTVSILLVCSWRGLINTYVCKEMDFSLSQAFLEGFDLMIEKIKK